MLDHQKFEYMKYLPKAKQDTFRWLSRDVSMLPEAQQGAERQFNAMRSGLSSFEAKALDEVRSRGWENVLPETEQFARSALSRPPSGGINPSSALPPFCSGH